MEGISAESRETEMVSKTLKTIISAHTSWVDYLIPEEEIFTFNLKIAVFTTPPFPLLTE